MVDKIFELIKKEEKRQVETLMMIPSENYTYQEVREAVGSVLMHKYAEGLPYKRYYQGNIIANEVEALCQKLALETFSLDPKNWFVNVQPHSGSEANLAALTGLIQPGDKILSMYLPDGGHLSHGWQLPRKKISLTSKIFDIEFYRVDEKTRVFDYDQIEKQALKFKPKLIISGGTAYPRQIDYQRMAQIARTVGAFYLADIAHEAGLVAGGANDSPFPHANVVTMTTHKTLRGPRGAMIFGKRELEDQINSAVFPGLQGGPHLNVIAGIAITLAKTKTSQFQTYATQTVANARYLAQYLSDAGFDVVSGGTDKHLILIDLRKSQVGAWFVALALEQAGIIINKNTVPFDNSLAYYPSGIRLGTPALTVRGMKSKQMKQIGNWIIEVIAHIGKMEIPADKDERLKSLKKFSDSIKTDGFYQDISRRVKTLCYQFPIPDFEK
jgi:glycine hydroxymethyltransferase